MTYGADSGDTAIGHPWWRGATVYQIYPRSFADSNGDGIGDLPGITARLDYVASLGVDAVWLSPFFRSPMKDFGYDIADYCDVDPIFGTLADFDALVERAHALGLRLLIDQVYSHTSDRHEWFTQSRANGDNERADWYVWADPKPDGSPPNNWQSVFGGPAWTWDARRQQYYMHNFLSSQPQLNGHNPAVQDALLAVARFWLDRGVDGFRVDAINFLMHNRALTDNPAAPPSNRLRTRSFDYQLKINNQSQPEIPVFIERFRMLTDSYEDRFTVAEVGGDQCDRETKLYTAHDRRFCSAYGFNFLYADRLTPQLVREAIENWPDVPGVGWPTWAFSNHDAPRWVSRWARPADRAAFAHTVMLLFICLRGNIIIWQGEELGLTQVDIAFEDLKDPEAIANWPLTLSRDGTRTPMPWQSDALNCGFSTGRPWLPIGEDHPALAVDRQQDDPASMLSFTRALIAMRKGNDALRHGNMTVLKAENDLLTFTRTSGTQQIFCAFNLGGEPIDGGLAPDGRWRIVESVNGATMSGLPGFGGLIAEQHEA